MGPLAQVSGCPGKCFICLMMTSFADSPFKIGERDRLKNELEHEQRITLEVESWLRDRQAHLNQLVSKNQLLTADQVYKSHVFMALLEPCY
jgi:hypothetical protein